jgi:hypothetical protein
MSKTLYSFSVTINVEVEEEKAEIVVVDGSETKRVYKEKIKKDVPVEIVIKQPSRRQIQDADMEFSVEMSKCIKNGVLTKAMLLNKYSDMGGLISDSDAKSMIDVSTQLQEIQGKMSILKAAASEGELNAEDKKTVQNYEAQVYSLRKQLSDRESSYISLFNHTADIKAQNKAILWYILYLTFYKDLSSKMKDFEPMFPGKTFEAKEEQLFKLDEEENEVFVKSYSDVAKVVSYWYFTGITDKEEFDAIMKEDSEEEESDKEVAPEDESKSETKD